MNADEKRKVFEELLEGYQDYIESEFSYDDGEREAERKAWLNKYDGIKEPLIKNEKIRKAVRAWADADGADEKIYLTIDENGSRFANKYGGYIEFAFQIDMEERLYTIAELCGEEEE